MPPSNHFSPHLIVALGQKAFDYAVRSETGPLLYALVAAPDEVPTSRTDITGISLNVSPKRQLALFASAFSFKKLGVVYSEKHGAALCKAGKKSCSRTGYRNRQLPPSTTSRKRPASSKALRAGSMPSG